MGFIKETYSNGNAGLVVSFAQTGTSDSFCDTDSVEEAMKHFHLYLGPNNQLRVDSDSEQAMNTLEIAPSDAKVFRQKVDTLLVSLTDEQALQNVILFPTWAVGVEYKVEDRVRYNNKLYRVLQAHTSQADWTPDVAASLFASLLIDEVTGEILDWVQPDSTNPYMKGDKVRYNGLIYTSQVDNNVWEPGSDTNLWTVGSAIEEETPTTQTVENYVAANPYMIGDQVMFNGKKYESLIDNNVWSPTDYPAGWEEIIA